MFFSEKYNILYIAIPKTGSTAIESHLKKIDSDGSNHSIFFKNKLFKGKDLKSGVLGHAKAEEFVSIFGEDIHKLNTITFVRHPYSRLVSSYYFNREKNVSHFLKIKGLKGKWSRRLKNFSSILLAKGLPFKIWAILYPYKTNYEFIYNSKGEKLVKFIGRTEYLDSDLKHILSQIGINSNEGKVARINTSKHKNVDQYFKNGLFKYFINMKCQEDIDIYENIESSIRH